MKNAAYADCLSIGGLFHYFPTKRDLVLHDPNLSARDRLCREHRERLQNLADWTSDDGIGEYLDHSMMMFAFMRPSARAALELGEASLHKVLDTGLTHNVAELAETL